jgi:hypothetical protein
MSRDLKSLSIRKSLFLFTTLSVLLAVCSRLEFLSGCSAEPATAFSLASSPSRTAGSIPHYFRQSGGRPVFPLGFYHVSWKTSPAKRQQHLREIAAAEFNIVHASAPQPENYGAFLDEADRLGVKVITEHNLEKLPQLAKRFANKPAVLGWNIADDVDNGKKGPEFVLATHQLLKAAVPSQPTYISGYTDRIQRFAGCSDILGMQSYPIRKGSAKELAETYQRIRLAQTAAKSFNQPVYANLQTYSWQVHPEKRPGDRAPTPAELRNMTYQSLIAGANGIVYYTYHDGAWHLPDHPALWAGVKQLAPEIKQLSPFLLHGQRQILQDKQDLYAGLWQWQKQAIVIVLSTQYDRTLDVSLPLSSPYTKIAPLFQRQARRLKMAQQRLIGQIQPLDVQIYRLHN